MESSWNCTEIVVTDQGFPPCNGIVILIQWQGDDDFPHRAEEVQWSPVDMFRVILSLTDPLSHLHSLFLSSFHREWLFNQGHSQLLSRLSFWFLKKNWSSSFIFLVPLSFCSTRSSSSSMTRVIVVILRFHRRSMTERLCWRNRNRAVTTYETLRKGKMTSRQVIIFSSKSLFMHVSHQSVVFIHSNSHFHFSWWSSSWASCHKRLSLQLLSPCPCFYDDMSRPSSLLVDEPSALEASPVSVCPDKKQQEKRQTL